MHPTRTPIASLELEVELDVELKVELEAVLYGDVCTTANDDISFRKV